jgi:hypothetical protein
MDSEFASLAFPQFMPTLKQRVTVRIIPAKQHAAVHIGQKGMFPTHRLVNCPADRYREIRGPIQMIEILARAKAQNSKVLEEFLANDNGVEIQEKEITPDLSAHLGFEIAAVHQGRSMRSIDDD